MPDEDNTGTLSHTVTGLANDTDYAFQLRAVAGSGEQAVRGAPSGTVQARPGADVPVNRAPEVSQTLAAPRLCVGETTEIGLSGYFTDPDGDVLSYGTSRAADSQLVTLTVSGDRLTLTGVRAGRTTVTVEAVDPDGLMVSQVVDVEVCAETDEVSQARSERIGSAVLPRVSQALVAGTQQAVTGRVESMGSTGRGATTYQLGGQFNAGASVERTIYNVLKSAEQGLSGQGGVDWGRLLGNTSFSMSLAGLAGMAGADVPAEDGAPVDGAGTSWLSDTSIWGQGVYRNLSRNASPGWTGTVT